MQFFSRINNTFSVLVPTVIQLSPFAGHILRELSNELTDKEKQTLLSKYTWPRGDESTLYMNQDGSIFLAELYFKEVQEGRQDIDFRKFHFPFRLRFKGYLFSVNYQGPGNDHFTQIFTCGSLFYSNF